MARALEVFDASLGTCLMGGNQFNVKGHWEDLDFQDLNKEMLAATAREWHHVKPLDALECDLLYEKYSLRASQLLLRKIPPDRPFGVKDPRFCLLLSFWRKVFLECGVDASYVIALRNPLGVARSLETRNQFPKEKSYWIWITHVLGALRDSDGSPRILVDYNELLLDPKRQCQRVAKALQLNINEEKLEHFQGSFLDSAMDHSGYQESTPAVDPASPVLANQIYQTLHQIAVDPASSFGTNYQKRFEIWIDKFSMVNGLLSVFQSNEVAFREIKTLTVRRKELIGELRAVVSERDRRINFLIEEARKAGEESQREIETLRTNNLEMRRSLDAVEDWQRSWFRRAFSRWHRVREDR